jgi:ABC-2 type transport system ATP-binding protein
VIEIIGLQKTYRRWRRPPTVAVDHLDLSVPEGGVFGFLGPNGSGKTTTIRCLLGLARPTTGAIRVLGRPVPDGLSEVMRSIGAVVENAAFLPSMSGREQIRLLAGIDGIPRQRADDALEQVGLGPRATDAVKGYSLGMRQRLALAGALVKDPALLVLDEPANGLDPAGMRDIRELLRRLGDEGRTVFLSSHLLSEVEQTCDRVAILSRGRCLVSGPVGDLLRDRGGAWLVSVPPEELTAAGEALRRAGMESERVGDRLRIRSAADGAAITRTLGEAGVWLSGLRQEETHLEDLFLELTGAPELVGAR